MTHSLSTRCESKAYFYATSQIKRAEPEGKIQFGNVLTSALYGYVDSKVFHSSHMSPSA
jgi:hypothetical protein